MEYNQGGCPLGNRSSLHSAHDVRAVEHDHYAHCLWQFTTMVKVYIKTYFLNPPTAPRSVWRVIGVTQRLDQKASNIVVGNPFVIMFAYCSPIKTSRERGGRQAARARRRNECRAQCAWFASDGRGWMTYTSPRRCHSTRPWPSRGGSGVHRGVVVARYTRPPHSPQPCTWPPRWSRRL